MPFKLGEQRIDQVALAFAFVREPQLGAHPRQPGGAKEIGNTRDDRLRFLDPGLVDGMDCRQQSFGETRHVPVHHLRLAPVGIATVRIDRTEHRIRGKTVHEGAGAIVDRLTADRDIVGVHYAVDEADGEPMRDKLALQVDDLFQQRKRRIAGFGEFGKMTLDRIVGEPLQMVGAEMGGEELEGADADVAARHARQDRTRVGPLALHALAGRDRGERAGRGNAHRRHRL